MICIVSIKHGMGVWTQISDDLNVSIGGISTHLEHLSI